MPVEPIVAIGTPTAATEEANKLKLFATLEIAPPLDPVKVKGVGVPVNVTNPFASTLNCDELNDARPALAVDELALAEENWASYVTVLPEPIEDNGVPDAATVVPRKLMIFAAGTAVPALVTYLVATVGGVGPPDDLSDPDCDKLASLRR